MLLSIIGFLISIVGVLGKREISAVERSSAKIEERVGDLYKSLGFQIGPIVEKQIQYGSKLNELEKFRDYYNGLEEGRGKRLGEIEGTVRVLMSEKEALGQRVAHLEGKEDRREVNQRESGPRR